MGEREADSGTEMGQCQNPYKQTQRYERQGRRRVERDSQSELVTKAASQFIFCVYNLVCKHASVRVVNCDTL